MMAKGEDFHDQTNESEFHDSKWFFLGLDAEPLIRSKFFAKSGLTIEKKNERTKNELRFLKWNISREEIHYWCHFINQKKVFDVVVFLS